MLLDLLQQTTAICRYGNIRNNRLAVSIFSQLGERQVTFFSSARGNNHLNAILNKGLGHD